VSTAKQPWLGHSPLTLAALEALASKWSESEQFSPTHSEKVLYVASAFWSSVARETLDDFCGAAVLVQLRSARGACAEIGADVLVGVLQRKLAECGLNAQKIATAASDLQNELLRLGDGMDELIERYAAQYLRETSSK
jgi:DNA-binding FrmR family transcriptional regulator